MSFNFCRFYNKTINKIEEISIKNGAGTIHDSPRKNRDYINIFEGVFYILIASIGLICIIPLVKFAKLIDLIINLTTSHCDLKELK